MRGDIVHVEGFQFSDRSRGNKFAVVLNSPNPADPILVIKTTSNPARYAGAVEGCNQKLKVFLLRGNTRKALPVDTYIQLDEIFEFEQSDFEEGKHKKKIQKADFLPDQIFHAVKNCLKLLREDIPTRIFDVLFSKQ